MEEKPSVSPAELAKAKLFSSLNTTLILAVVSVAAFGVFGYDFKTCAACDGVGKFFIACSWCDGDGKVSLWKGFRQVPRASASPKTPEKKWKLCDHFMTYDNCTKCRGNSR